MARSLASLGHLGGQCLSKGAEVRVEVDRGGVLDPPDLIADRLHHLRMTVPARHGDDAGKEVEVAAAGLVVQVLHVALDQHQGF
jgi:hypothetical protein